MAAAAGTRPMSLTQIVALIFASLLLALLLFGSAAPAKASPPCGPATKVAAMLLFKYHEVPVAGGLISPNRPGARLMIVASKRGTFTVLIWRTDDTVCPIASGTHWWTKPGKLERKAFNGP